MRRVSSETSHPAEHDVEVVACKCTTVAEGVETKKNSTIAQEEEKKVKSYIAKLGFDPRPSGL